mmetsp:Transcript_2072/g.6302  ORF Transcript_2072/g.6302 Transcript_2072/m.6302 type:complete len:333 (-) Transcript_2072:1082-2080(-)
MTIPPEASKLANEANAVFVDEDYETALELYTEAIKVAPTSADLYVSRAVVHLKMDNFTSAIADANKAIENDPQNSKAYLRKGIACFNMEEFATAKKAFEQGKQIDPDNNQFKTWIRKCNAELEEEMAGDEMPVPHSNGTSVAPAPAPVQNVPQPPPPKTVQRFRHDFIQNPTFVTVTVYIKGADRENCDITFEPRALSIDWTISKDDSWQISFDPLYDEIIPDESTTNFYSTKVEIKMKKKNPVKWDSLEVKADEKPLDELSEEEIRRRRDYYPSSKSQGGAAKNWDKICNEIPEDKLEGEEALNSFFQQIYGRGSDEVSLCCRQQRAMCNR